MQLTIENQTGFDLELKNSGSLVQSISSEQTVLETPIYGGKTISA